MNYDDLIKKLRSRRVCVQSGGDLEHGFPLMWEAAEVIEKLREDLSYWTEAYWDLWRKRQWISVQERLPEKTRGHYLCLLDDDSMAVCYWSTAIHSATEWEWHNPNWKEVTHWMPLPPRPDHIGDANEMV